MATQYSVSLAKIIEAQSLEVLYTPKDPKDIYITSAEVNRPGLILAGYDDYFDPGRIQFLGLSEMGYLNNLDDEVRKRSVERLLSKKPSAIIITRSLEYFQDLRFGRKIWYTPSQDFGDNFKLHVGYDILFKCGTCAEDYPSRRFG